MGFFFWDGMKHPLFPVPMVQCVLCGEFLISGDYPDRPHSVCTECWERLLRWRYSSYALRCPYCGEVRLQSSVPCPRCKNVQETVVLKGRIVCCGPYRGDGKTLLVSYKFHARRSLASLVASLLLLELSERYGDAPLFLIPVPSSRKNRRRRGWDQMRLVCRLLATVSKNVKVLPVLVRVGDLEQKTLGREMRLSCADTRFRIDRDGGKTLSKMLVQHPQARFVVVDDVLTTGSTVNACRKLIVSVIGEDYADKVDALVLCED